MQKICSHRRCINENSKRMFHLHRYCRLHIRYIAAIPVRSSSTFCMTIQLAELVKCCRLSTTPLQFLKRESFEKILTALRAFINQESFPMLSLFISCIDYLGYTLYKATLQSRIMRKKSIAASNEPRTDGQTPFTL